MKTLTEMIMKASDASWGFTYFEQGQESRLGGAQFREQALRHLKYMRLHGADENSVIIIQIENDLKFLTVFWACILGGMKIALLPHAKNQHAGSANQYIMASFGKPFVCISKEERTKEDFCMQFGCPPQIVIDVRNSYVDDSTGDVAIYEAKKDDVAVIQFSSGSTSAPKGICTTHENIVETAVSLNEVLDISSQDKSFSWLPLNHNLALLGVHMTGTYTGGEQYYMSVYEFLANPLKWMQYISDKAVTVTASPNFGYKHFLSFYEKCAKKPDWDLSGLKLLINGAEPISYELSELFLSSLSRHGLRDSVIFAGYGLSETTVCVCGSQFGSKLKKVGLSRDKMNIGDEVEIDDNGAVFVSVGKPLRCNDIRITGNDGRLLGQGTIGNIEVRGKNVMNSYFNDAKKTEEAFTPDGWLKTGDVGVIINELVYVTGRSKDIIFIAGKNYFPNDFEKLIEDEFPELKNKIAVCGIHSKTIETEQIALFVETGNEELNQELMKEVRQFFSKTTQLQINRVTPVGELPRTPNGKLQRYKLL
ncbi:MAG: AMP-binding protein [Clostridiales bacterium]|nr:AMP-binding protein [Clostridiales bacterium]